MVPCHVWEACIHVLQCLNVVHALSAVEFQASAGVLQHLDICRCLVKAFPHERSICCWRACRELAMQLADQFRALGAGMSLTVRPPSPPAIIN